MMKRLLLFALAAASLLGTASAKPNKTPALEPAVSRIDPPNWFAGLNDPSLQLMVYGKGIADADVKIDYAGAAIDSIVRLDSKNYLLIYLNLSGAQPGTMNLALSLGKKSFTVPYELKRREMAGEKRMGFTNADVLYMLMPDRFADGNADNNQISTMRSYKCDRSKPSTRHGGDIEGIRKHLDYFNELGVTALWFTPVLENDSPDRHGHSTYHGYATTDYYRVDPRFGTNDEYRRLADECHKRGIKLVMDMIFNHCGFEHPWVADQPSKDWFNLPEWLEQSNGKPDASGTNYMNTSYKLTPIMDPYASDIDLKETTQGWFVPTMPDLNQYNPHVMDYLIQNSVWWIETVGIDGIRMDTYPYAYAAPMARWMKRISDEYPNFNVVGETWVTEPGYTAAWQKDSKVAKENSFLPTVMDFAFYDRIDKTRTEETDEWWGGFNRVYNSLVYDFLYPNPAFVMAFIENHDTDRFLRNTKDVEPLKQALAMLLTMKRTPQLYYGTEILMNGTKEKSDGNVRCDFPGGFPGDTRNAFTEQGRTKEENEMFNWLKNLLHWRQGNDLVIKGSQKQFMPHKGVYVLARQYNGRTAMLILNGTSKQAEAQLSRYKELIKDAKTAREVQTGATVDLTKETITLTPRQTILLEF